VWQLAHALTLDVWHLTHRFPREEQWVLVPQMRRAAVSIPGNTSEGCGLDTMPQLHKHVVIASGSSSELEYHFLLARDLGYLGAGRHAELLGKLTDVRRMLAGFASWSAR
jgi:four helix bundle protein